MSSPVTVTIGMCVKNAESSVHEALASVNRQDFPHEQMELIVVDGDSDDNTLSIIHNILATMPVTSRIFSEHEGLGKARQIVVNRAKGDYIVWVDGDMVISPDFVRRQVNFMETNLHVGIAKGRYASSPGPNLLATLEIYSRTAAKLGNYSSNTAPSKSLGTSGCIYRVKAIRQVGGFDEGIVGYGEDWDAEVRTRAAGWQLATTAVQYRDYERLGVTWKDLWQRYWRRGYDLYAVLQKHTGIIDPVRMLPPAAFLSGLRNSLAMYPRTHKKAVFLLPVQHALKMIAWWTGFLTARSAQ